MIESSDCVIIIPARYFQVACLAARNYELYLRRRLKKRENRPSADRGYAEELANLRGQMVDAGQLCELLEGAR
jgi:hypothetical protein